MSYCMPFISLVIIRFLTVSLCRKSATHDSEIRYLYEEMEAQIKNEKDRLILKVHKHKKEVISCLKSTEKKVPEIMCQTPLPFDL